MSDADISSNPTKIQSNSEGEHRTEICENVLEMPRGKPSLEEPRSFPQKPSEDNVEEKREIRTMNSDDLKENIIDDDTACDDHDEMEKMKEHQTNSNQLINAVNEIYKADEKESSNGLDLDLSLDKEKQEKGNTDAFKEMNTVSKELDPVRNNHMNRDSLSESPSNCLHTEGKTDASKLASKAINADEQEISIKLKPDAEMEATNSGNEQKLFIKIETDLEKKTDEMVTSIKEESLKKSFTEKKLVDDKSSKRKHRRKQSSELDEGLLNTLIDMPEVLEYIRKLEKIIEKQLKKIMKWKRKAKKKYVKTKNASTQTKLDINSTFVDNNALSSLSNPENQESFPQTEENPKSLVDDITEAAENALQNSGFVYEETSGMYYDYNTGYYYNAEYRLYYDGNTGTYLSYNQDTNTYEFHSQVSVMENKPTGKDKRKTKRKSNRNKSKETKRFKRDDDEENWENKDQEEGECSDSSHQSSSEVEDDDQSSNSEEDGGDVSKQWPPCMRIIVEQTDDSKLKVGSLHIITCDGGTLGREGNHSILLRDINVSKHHLKFQFDKEAGKYMISDLGSRNGTILNGKRISVSKQESELQEIVHGSRIQIGTTILLCHIHRGTQTCGHCEPGLLVQETRKEMIPTKPAKSSMSDRHRTELRNLKKKQGLLGFTDEGEKSKLGQGYTDRAQKRRETVGSQNPYEKTESASVAKNIPSENKGFKMLEKMGWKKGQSLGKEGDGLLEPVPMISNPGTAGMGNTDPTPTTINLTKADKVKKTVWRKTQERFDKLPDTKAFLEETDSD